MSEDIKEQNSVGTSHTFSPDELEGGGKETGDFLSEQAKADAAAAAAAAAESGEGLGDDNKSLPEAARLASEYGVSEGDINYAKKLGWSPKEKFHGDPKDWKGPAEFIQISEESAPILRERNRKMAEDMKKMQDMMPRILDAQVREKNNQIAKLAEENKDLASQLQDAIDMMDAKRASEITARMNANSVKGHIMAGEVKQMEKDAVASDIPGRDLAKETAWAQTVWGGLSLEQRETYKQAAAFIDLPSNRDMTTEQRIEYMEKKVYGKIADRGTTGANGAPAAAMVSRPSGFSPNGSAGSSETPGWDAMSADEKRIASSMMENVWWWDRKDSDPKAKAEFGKWKKQF